MNRSAYIRRLPVWIALALLSCGGNPWSVAGAPTVPPDAELRTGVEAGEDVYVWRCYRGERVVVRQYGTACTGTRAPVLDRGPCGAPLPVEADYPSVYADTLPDDRRWPGVPASGLPKMARETDASAAPD